MTYIQHRAPTRKILETVKSVIMGRFYQYTQQPNKVLDLFCGRGYFTLHLRQYSMVDYVVGIDRDISLIKKLERQLTYKNIKHKLFCMDAFQFKFNISFDIIFIDPPFRFDMCTRIMNTISNKNLVGKNTLIILRNLVQNAIEIDSNKFEVIYDIVIGQNQVLFILPKEWDLI